MPKRPREHRLETDSQSAFQDALGDQLLFRPEHPDYGIDGDVEEFDSEDRATGLRFYVQLKATDEKELTKALAVPLPIDLMSYYRSLALPVLMVRHHAPAGVVYARWFHQYDPYYSRGGAKARTFRWSEQDAWDAKEPERLIAEARAFLEVRSRSLALPRRFHLRSEGAFGLTAAELRLSLRAQAERASDVVEMVGGEPDGGDAWFEVTYDRLVANLANVTAATLHLADGYDPGEHGERLATDAFVIAAVAFGNVGQDEIASRLVDQFASDCSLLGSVEIVWALQAILARARRIREGLHLAGRLDESENPDKRGAGFAFTLPALIHAASLRDEDVELYAATLRARIERREAEGKPIEASREHINLANFHRFRQEGPRAVALYHKAAECDPAYLDRAHYWFELGGALFLSDRFAESADAYARAIELGAEPIAKALYADARIFAGKYRAARDLLREFNAEHAEVANEPRYNEYRLKQRVVDAIVERLGIEQQERDIPGAARAHRDLQAPEEIAENSHEQLAYDALWNPAWFNLGLADLEADRPEDALTSFVAATVLMPAHDLEPWRNAFWIAINLEDEAVVVDLLTTGRRMAGQPLIDYLVHWAREQDGNFRDRVLSTVDEVLSRFPERRTQGFTMRLIGDGPDVEVMEVGPDSAPPD